MAKKITVLAAVFVLLALGGSVLYAALNLRPYGEGEPGEFVVEKGESLFSVLDRLEERRLIRSAPVAKGYVRLFRRALIKSGTYSVDPGMSPGEILDLFVEGRQALERVTIPEGLTAREIARILQEAGILSDEQAFLDLTASEEFVRSLGVEAESLDGYLFPDTYYFQKDFPPQQVLSHLVGTFFRTLEEIYPYYRDFSAEKMREKLVVASIVEKEYRVPEEAGRIASVFYNRLNIGMPLQSCATVIYVMTEEQGKAHPSRIFERDLKIPSPYNTYYSDTLPPGPISNPGRVALDAVFNPDQTDYLFFVVKNAAQGTHTFTSNLSDHNVARQAYLQGFRSK